MITNFGVNRTFNTYEFKLKTLSNDSNIIHNYNDISFVTEATSCARWCVNLVCLTVLFPYQMARGYREYDIRAKVLAPQVTNKPYNVAQFKC